MDLKDLSQSRLALFVVDAVSGRPLRRIPVYAEAVLTESAGHLPTNTVTSRSLNVLLRQNPALAAAIQRAVIEAIDTTVLPTDPMAIEHLVLAAERALNDAGYGGSTYDHERMDAIVRNAVAVDARRQNLPPAPPPPPPRTYRVPLGVLASDHTGFLAWDLARVALMESLPTQQREGVTLDFHVYPMMRDVGRMNVLEQARIAPDAIVGKLEFALDALELPGFALNLPAMQNPGLVDWRLSPGSFAAVPQHLIGLDGCEALTPANFATSQFHMRQVVRLDEKRQPGYPAAHVFEYAVTLIPIGHSLGQVQYSLPLAPGESVRLAVIDWRRTDSAQRTETTKLTESLVHEQTRDRTITETVHAAINEWQRGGSVMGGLAGGGGASGQVGATSVVGGGMLSLGGAYATSSGSRDVAGDTTQKITDAIHQASVSVREIQSTVVVQTDQQEGQNIQTRAFANHNRGHTLTILYYEVLRHFRVVTELTRRYDAVLVARPNWNLNDEVTILNKRFILQPALLDPTLSSAFDALLRADKTRKERIRNPPVQVIPFDEANLVFDNFEIRFRIGTENSSEEVNFLFVLASGQELLLPFAGGFNANYDEEFDKENQNTTLLTSPMNIRWGDIRRLHFRKGPNGGEELRVTQLDVIGHSSRGARQIYYHVPGATYRIKEDYEGIDIAPLVPPPPPPPTLPVPTLEQALSLDDYALIQRLKEHLVSEASYYTRLLDLALHPDTYATRFENETWSGTTNLIDVVAPTPLEVMGSRIAFPMLQQPDERLKPVPSVERLVSLPTRGIFAEGKLGHCNVAEEIDEARFWRWDEHPLPFMASDIAAVQPIQPKPQTPNLAPSVFPAPTATIQAVAALPDPTGMAAVLKALTTPDIFRDMSAKDEVQKLVSDLIEGAVDMAEAANRAREIKSKMDTDLDRQQREQATKALESNNTVRRAEIEAQREKAQQVTPEQAQHAIKLIDNQHNQGKIDTPTRNDKVNTVLGNTRSIGSQQPSAPAPAKPLPLPTSGKGLVFEINFQHVGDRTGRPVGGWAKVTVQSGVTGHWQEFARAQIINSSLRVDATEISDGGTVAVSVDYDWNAAEDVLADGYGKTGSKLKAIDHIRHFSGTGQYVAPDKGNLVQLTAKPATRDVKQKAMSSTEAATTVEAEGKAEVGIVSVGLKGTSGETTSAGSEREWTVYVLTGGLSVLPRS